MNALRALTSSVSNAKFLAFDTPNTHTHTPQQQQQQQQKKRGSWCVSNAKNFSIFSRIVTVQLYW